MAMCWSSLDTGISRNETCGQMNNKPCDISLWTYNKKKSLMKYFPEKMLFVTPCRSNNYALAIYNIYTD